LIENPQTAEWIFNIAFQSIILLGAGWLLTKICKKSSAPLRSGVSLSSLAILILLPLGILLFKSNDTSLFRSLGPSLHLQESQIYYAPLPMENGAISSGAQMTAPAKIALNGKDGHVKKNSNKKLWSINTTVISLNILGFIWMAGILVFLSRLAYGLASLLRFRKRLVKIDDERLIAALKECQSAFGNQKLPHIYTSKNLDSPITLGIRNPAVVIPWALYKKIDNGELKSILSHEISHIWHRDHWSGILQRIVQAFYWWNPLVYAVSSQFSIAREEVSDNYAIKKNGALSYAKCLVTLAKKTNLISRLPASIGMASPHISMEDRVKNIVSDERIMLTKLKRSLVYSIVLLSLLFALSVAKYSWTFVTQEWESRIIPMPDVIEPFTLVVYNDKIIIPEGTHISIFSQGNFHLEKKFGRRGEGPGEFSYPPHITAFPDRLLANTMGKLIHYSYDGDFVKETKIIIPYNYGTWPLLPVGKNYVGFPMEIEKTNQGTIQLRHNGRLYDHEFNPVKQLCEGIPPLVPPPPPPPRAGTQPRPIPKQDFNVIPEYVDYAIFDEKIFLADNRKGLYIAVFDQQGNLLYEINREYKTLKVPQEYKEAYMERQQALPNWESLDRQFNFKFKEKFPAFFSFKVVDNKIYVTTYAKKDDKYEVVVMDLEGKILKRSFSFPLPPYQDASYRFTLFSNEYDIYQDKIYYLAYNYDTDIYELHITPIK
jgi:beta-lactamase regulating signal transducer with metallopeptidase domain